MNKTSKIDQQNDNNKNNLKIKNKSSIHPDLSGTGTVILYSTTDKRRAYRKVFVKSPCFSY